MKNANDIYKKLLKQYPDWNIELDKYNNVILEKDSFCIKANEDMVNIYKKYNKFMCLDNHRHPSTLENMYSDIVYYINNKDDLLKKQQTKDKIFIVLLIVIIAVFIIGTLI